MIAIVDFFIYKSLIVVVHKIYPILDAQLDKSTTYTFVWLHFHKPVLELFD